MPSARTHILADYAIYQAVAAGKQVGNSVVNVVGLKDFLVVVNCTALTAGTTKNGHWWLEGTIDGNNWFALSHDGARTHTGTAADTAMTAAGNRNINGAAAKTAPALMSASYRDRALNGVRLAFDIELVGT